MRILVAGATGFIGSNLVRELLKENGINLILLVRDKSKLINIRNKYQVIEVNLLNKKELKKELDSVNEIDITYNVAGRLGSPRISYERLYDFNVMTVMNLLGCLKGKTNNFVHISSVAAMGDIHNYVDENFTCNPITDYDRVKYEGEKVVKRKCEEYGINYVIIRPTMVYGPEEVHTKLKLFKLIEKGMFFIPGKGENKMSWLYIDNLISVLLMFKHEKCNNEIYIISDKNPYSLNKIIFSISDVLNIRRPTHVPIFLFYIATILFEYISKVTKKEPILDKKRLMNMITERTYSIEKIRNELGYDPKIGLEEGIKKTFRWYKEKGLL